MSNSLLILPGDFMLSFVMALLGYEPHALAPGEYRLIAGFISLFFWVGVASWAVAFLKRITLGPRH